MGPTYIVLLEWTRGPNDIVQIVHRGDDEAKARELYDYACQRGLSNCTVYLTTVRAEARLS